MGIKFTDVLSVAIIIAGCTIPNIVFYSMVAGSYIDSDKRYEEGVRTGINSVLYTLDAQDRLAALPNHNEYENEVNATFVVNDTLAALNKNPLNVKFREDDPWEGQAGYDEFGHAVFDEWEYGIRAAALVLRSYAVIHEIDTVEGIVKRFAEGNQESYIDFLCGRLSVSPADSIDVIARMPELLRAMSRFESGMDLPDRYFAPYDILTKPLTPDNK